MNFLSALKKFRIFQLTPLMITQLLLTSCGGSGDGNTPTGNSSIRASSSLAITGSPGVSSSENSVRSSASSTPASSSISTATSTSTSTFASSQSSAEPAVLIDASNQFTATVNENFYVFKNPSQPGVLRYLPKQLALSGLPGIASTQRTNKVSNLLKVFLELSDTDWTSANQVTLSSRFTLDVDLQQLRDESAATGYTELVDVSVKPPAMLLEQRYTTAVPAAQIQIQCKNLTLIVEGNDVTLHDCDLADARGTVATQTINNIGSFRYEQLNFDPAAISGNKSLRGTFTIDYTLPGTREFDRILSTDNGNLQHTWQLYLNWPLAQTSVSSTTVTVDWKMLIASFNTQVSSGKTRWDENAISTFTAAAISSGAITLAADTTQTPELNPAIASYLTQELLVAIYSENGKSPLMWAPKLRFKNVDQPGLQKIVIRYFDSESPLISTINLSCLTKPDAQNNIYKSPACASNTIMR